MNVLGYITESEALVLAFSKSAGYF